MSGLPRITRLAFVWGLVACGTTVSMAAAQEARQEPAPGTAVTPRARFTVSQSQDPSPVTQRPGPFIAERFKRVQPASRNLFGLPAPTNRFGLNDQHVIVVSTLVLILGAVIIILLAT